MHKKTEQKGQSLMELLFAIALFCVAVFTIGYLFIDAHFSLQKNIDVTQARFLALEGIEIVRLLREENFEDLTTGTYHLVLSDNSWSLTPEEVEESSRYSRHIYIEEIDEETREITSEVRWTDVTSPQNEVSFTTYLTNWKGVAGDSAFLSPDVGAVTLSESGEELLNLSIENVGVEALTITAMSIQFDNAYTTHHITVDGTDVFSVLPESGISSGDTIDIGDYVLEAGAGPKNVSPISFSGTMYDTDFIVTFVLSDGSEKDVHIVF